MDDNKILEILLALAQQNAGHIDVLNRELGEIVAQVRIMTWFLAINVVAWVGLLINVVGKKLFNNKK